ncbi:hypothetical protein [Streptomyces sp. NPDC059455]|uniref:hypothetical protein n=1 Tax=Streptomyces sp. NPDC059455 TaxID=3346837 RepID=UPI0036A06B4F
MLGRTEEAEAEARRAYATEQNRRWFRANPNGVDVVAAATKGVPEPGLGQAVARGVDWARRGPADPLSPLAWRSGPIRTA